MPMHIFVQSEDDTAELTPRNVVYRVIGTEELDVAYRAAFDAQYARFGKQTAPNADYISTSEIGASGATEIVEVTV